LTVNIVIRTLNEGKYLPLCLALLEKQTYKDFKITVVDSGSNDLTLLTAKTYGCNLVKLKKYNPGKAINLGIAEFADCCEYSIILSAHCLPVTNTWLQNFVNFMASDDEIAGAYGAQLPMTYTSMDDTRDLAAVLRGNTGIRNDKFFHNANSIVRNSVWSYCPFSEEYDHIEDIVWAHDIDRLNKKIGYVKEASVTHYHGLNQHGENESFRARGLVNIFKNRNFIKFVHLKDLFDISEIRLCIITFEKPEITSTGDHFVLQLKNLNLTSKTDSMSEIIRKVNAHVAANYPHVIATSFVRTLNNDTLETINKCMTRFLDFFPNAVIPAVKDFGNYWLVDGSTVQPIQDSLSFASKKRTIVKEELLMGGVISLNALSHTGTDKIDDKLLEFIENA